MSVLGTHGHPLLIVFYLSLAIWTYSICYREIGDNLIYELYLLKHTLFEIIKLSIILGIECIAIYSVTFFDPKRSVVTPPLYDPLRNVLRHINHKREHIYIYRAFHFLKAHCFSTSSIYFVSWVIILCFSTCYTNYQKNGWRIRYE